MASVFKASSRRLWLIVALLLLGTGVALKDAAVEFWEEELEAYRQLEDTERIPGLSAHDLSGLEEIGLLIFGDAGLGDEVQHHVAEGMWRLCEEKSCALAIGLGDNIYPAGVTSTTDPQWQTAFESPYRRFVEAADRDFWMLVGNHDRRGSIIAQVRYSRQSPIWRMPGRDYAIPGLPDWLSIYALDTTYIAPGADIPPFQWAFEQNMREQLDRAAAHLCSKPGWRVLATHHPMISNGARNNLFREENVYEALRDFIESCGIHLVLSGHEHLQQHVQFDGVDYFIQGAASSTRERAKPLQYQTALSRYLGYEPGFGHLSFGRDSVEIQFSDRRGESLYRTKIDRVDLPTRRAQAQSNFAKKKRK